MASLRDADHSRTLTLGSDGKSHVTRSRVSLHALRHGHVSALIGADLDVVTISQRIGHANPAVTLAVYAHLFAGANKDAAAALAIEAAMDAKRLRLSHKWGPPQGANFG